MDDHDNDEEEDPKMATMMTAKKDVAEKEPLPEIEDVLAERDARAASGASTKADADKAAENRADAVEAQGEARADQLEAQADAAPTDAQKDALNRQADQVEENADRRADQIEQQGGNADGGMTTHNTPTTN